MKISKKQLLEGFDILQKINKFESPLYDPKKFKPRTPAYTPTLRSVPSFGGDYSVTIASSPTVQQRLKLTGTSATDTSLSRSERGVPEDRSKELIEPKKDQYYTRVTNWVNPKAYLGGMKSATFYDVVKRREPKTGDESLIY